MTYQDWIALGLSSGFCSPPECETHNGVTLTEEEEAEFEAGGDPCVPVLRLFPDGDAPKPK